MWTERSILVGAALLLVALSFVSMAGLHRNHYERRRYQLLEGRLAALERIIVGEHE